MKPSLGKPSFYTNLASVCVLSCLLVGCTVVGPASIRSGRLSYNNAINDTNNQQILMLVIQNRYEEGGSLLTVGAITANVTLTTGTGIEAGVGDSRNYTGNLVPFSAGAVYQENPTISYIPVAGAEYVRQVFSPIPISILAQMSGGALVDPASIYNSLLSNVNGMQNPAFHFFPTEPDQDFNRFVTIMTRLTQAHLLHWVENAQQPDTFSIVIDHYSPAYTADVHELLKLLGLPISTDSSARLILPVFLSLDGGDSGGLKITTRPVIELGEILSAAIDVPEEDQLNGIAKTYPPLGPLGKGLRIHYSETKPEHAAVAVEHRDGWFYIKENDQTTKRFFRLMGALWSITIAESTPKGHTAPVLTIPVSR